MDTQSPTEGSFWLSPGRSQPGRLHLPGQEWARNESQGKELGTSWNTRVETRKNLLAGCAQTSLFLLR